MTEGGEVRQNYNNYSDCLCRVIPLNILFL